MSAAARLLNHDVAEPINRSVRLAASTGTPENSPRTEVHGEAKASASSSSPLVLRVLSGSQAGAQARMRHTRLLVGNLQAECDVVLDIPTREPHSCLVRASRDGWTVLSISGELWLGQERVMAHEARPLASGDVLHLGGVAFCIADTRTIDWSQVAIPSLPLPLAATPQDQTAEPKSHAMRESKKQSRTATVGQRDQTRPTGLALLLLGAVAAAGVASMSQQALHPDEKPAVAPQDPSARARAILASAAPASELTAQADSIHPQRVLLGGYLPQRQDIDPIEAALRKEGLQPEHRWVAVNEIRLDLAQRLNLPIDRLHYSSQGQFAADVPGNQVPVLDRAIRRVLQDSAAINGITLQLKDEPVSQAAAQEPRTVTYQRAKDQPGGVAVQGLELLQPAPKLQRYVVRELRLGSLPSAVLDNGARYFEGSVLPGGATLVRITPQALQVQAGADNLTVPIEANVQVAGRAHPSMSRRSNAKTSVD